MTSSSKGDVNVNYSAYRPGATTGRSLAYLAVQFRVGLLSKWRPRFSGRHCADFGVDGSSLARNGKTWAREFRDAFSLAAEGLAIFVSQQIKRLELLWRHQFSVFPHVRPEL